MKNNLRAPPIFLVKRWGKNLSTEEVQTVNNRLKWRGQLGNITFCFKKKLFSSQNSLRT